MLFFRTIDDIRKARLPPNLDQVITIRMEMLLAGYGDDYDPDNDGYIVLIDAETTDEDIRALTGRSVLDLIFESVERDDSSNSLVGYWMANNEFGLIFVLDPDDPEVDPIIRDRFLSELQDTGRIE